MNDEDGTCPRRESRGSFFGVLGPTDKEIRIAVYYYYFNVLKCPPESMWFGRSGSIATTMEKFPLDFDATREVFEAVSVCNSVGIKYEGFNTRELVKALVKYIQKLRS